MLTLLLTYHHLILQRACVTVHIYKCILIIYQEKATVLFLLQCPYLSVLLFVNFIALLQAVLCLCLTFLRNTGDKFSA